MFKKIYLDPENKTFAEVMSNGKSYAVPAFQRDYTWAEEQLDELWRDMQYIQAHKAQHFMGYLVLQSADNKFFQIIDGQQRITTSVVIPAQAGIQKRRWRDVWINSGLFWRMPHNVLSFPPAHRRECLV